MHAREIAKFLSGFAANQVLTHGVMAATDTEFTLLGIAYTRELNTTAVIVWASLLALLVYYAWIRRSDVSKR
ncbi:MAG: hypothetical protein K2Y17_04480 [Qipengyuania sp.]|nr:hypothetical protein [Qipengyuania sp.]